MQIYLDTSLVIALADPLDIFHERSIVFLRSLSKRKAECVVSGPLLVEVGRLVEAKGPARHLDILDALGNFAIDFRKVAMEKAWDLSMAYLAENVLTSRHRVDLLHYASASLLGCKQLASWNTRQFNEKVAAKVNKVNSTQGLLNLIAGSPEYIIGSKNLG